MASITRTNTETVATVSSSARKVTVTVNKSLTIEESRDLRKILKAEEAKASRQGEFGNIFGIDLGIPNAFRPYRY